MSVPADILAVCYAVCAGPTLGVLAVDRRLRSGDWPRPDRVDWRGVARVSAGYCVRRLSAWARDWRAEGRPVRRLAGIVLGLGLLVRAGVWSLAFAIGGDGNPEVGHAFEREPIAGARLDTRVAIAVAQLALVGLMIQWAGGLVFAWPPEVKTAVSALWAAQALPLLADSMLTSHAVIQAMMIDTDPETEVYR
jgi:hypothetical protein